MAEESGTTHLFAVSRFSKQEANARRVNGTCSCATGWGVRQVDYCRAESGYYELQRVALALAEGACFRKDKTDNAILLGDVRCSQSG
eukprot:1627141-Rhodomonas_salina.1